MYQRLDQHSILIYRYSNWGTHKLRILLSTVKKNSETTTINSVIEKITMSFLRYIYPNSNQYSRESYRDENLIIYVFAIFIQVWDRECTVWYRVKRSLNISFDLLRNFMEEVILGQGPPCLFVKFHKRLNIIFDYCQLLYLSDWGSTVVNSNRISVIPIIGLPQSF